mgnify:CR=1 FL=1
MDKFLYDNIVKIAMVITLPLWTAFALAEDIEEVIVVAQQVETTEADGLTTTTLVDSIVPEFTWTAGGYGGFQGYNERGAQTVHTSVYKNGVPQNTPGSAWYDFGHDIVSGQSVKVISGANGVMYGSGSIAGTILIEDTISRSVTAKVGNDAERYLSVAPTNWIQLTDFKTKQHARNDNSEFDEYENQSVKIIADAGDFEIIVSGTDYAYDYDNCYTASFSQTNDCLQDGERFTVSIRNEYFTIGRTEDKAEYFSEGELSYENKSSRDYFRVGDTTRLSNLLEVTYGADGSKDQYGDYEQDNYGVFFSVNAEFALKYNFGIRYGNADQNALRLGIEKGPFFFNAGTSFRRPNLYETFGDSWVVANEDLMPEEGVGYELGFGALSLFKYDFEQAIEYASSYTTTVTLVPATYDEDGNILTEAVTEDVFTPATYYNSGSYTTQGIRFANTWGPFSLMLKINDTDQVRIPEYVAVLEYQKTFKDIDFRIKYAGQFDRKPGAYDFLPEGQEYLDDLTKINVYVGKTFANGVIVNFTVDNITGEDVEVLPYYSSQGREYQFTVRYLW